MAEIMELIRRDGNTKSRGIPGAGIFGGDFRGETNVTNGTVIECRENAPQVCVLQLP